MRVDVRLNSNDFKKYHAAAIKFWSKKKNRKFNQADAILYTGLFFILLFYALGTCLHINWSQFLIGLLVGIILLFMLLNEQKKILEPKEDGFVFGTTEYEFLKEGISIKKEYSQSFTKWEAVEKIHNAKDYFYIYIDHNLAYIIPKRCFNTLEKQNELKSLLDEYLPEKIFNK